MTIEASEMQGMLTELSGSVLAGLGKEVQDPPATPAADPTPATPETPEKDETAATPQQADPVKPADPPKVRKVPETWKPEVRAKWDTVDDEVKDEILRREQSIFDGIEQYKKEAQFGKSIQSMLNPYMQKFAEAGLNPVQAVQNLMAAHHTLSFGTPENKLALFKRLIQDYQLDPRSLVDGQQADDTSTGYVDPAVANLTQQFNALKSEREKEKLAAQQAVEAENMKKVQEFVAQKEKYPLMNEVWQDMVNLLQTSAANSLEDAYDKAVWTNPVTRAKQLAQQEAAAVEKAKKEAAEKAAKAARQAGATITTKPKPASGTTPLGSMDQTMAKVFDEIKNRPS